MILKLLQEMNKLADQLFELDRHIELQLQESLVEEAEQLVEQRERLINIITQLFETTTEDELSFAEEDVLKVIQNKLTIILNNNEDIVALFEQTKEKLESEIQLLRSSKRKVNAYGQSARRTINKNLTA
jgi:rRNA pseudouridine-1189 N-methylase Emg1 (Nep1/Mra1 family)